MSPTIRTIKASEILDSRGNPTLMVALTLSDGWVATASVPAGASTGQREARELRDGDPRRYGGKGVLKAASNINSVISPRLNGLDPRRQAEIDGAMIELDGTKDKSHLGANAIVGVSMAVARAGAHVERLPLYAYLAEGKAHRLPVPMLNVVNGGAHAQNSIDFQEYMLVPHGAPNFAEALRYGAETFHSLRQLLHADGLSTGFGDEGGFAPDLASNSAGCDYIVRAIEAAGFRPGRDISIAIDAAASAFWREGTYQLDRTNEGQRTAEQMTAFYIDMLERFPIVLLEDGLGENDWEGFRHHTRELGSRLEIVGDDIYVTNVEMIQRGIAEGTTNAALIKPNQIGTVTETLAAVSLCRQADWHFMMSHRSGETEDSFIADLAVAMGGGQLKAGAPNRGERLAKYNRLLEIERELGGDASFTDPFSGR